MDSNDPQYKKKRKALSSAFLRGKFDLIAHMVKKSALTIFAELQSQGESTEVELNAFTSKVQAHIIVSILIGSGYSYKKLQYRDLLTGEESAIPLAEIFDKIIPDILLRMQKNPLLGIYPKFFEKQIFAIDRHFHFNCNQLRECIRQIIEDRKNTKNDDTNDFGGDVISLLL